MRVLMLNSHGADRTYGGAERYVSDLTDGLERRGHEVQLVSAFPVRDASADRTWTMHRTDWRDDPLRRYRNHAGDWIAGAWPYLEELLRAAAPDLVNTNNLPGISTGLWERARRLGIPVVHSLHDYHLLCPRTSLTRRDGTPCQPSPLICGLRNRRLARWSGGVTVAINVSHHVRRRHEGFFGPETAQRLIRSPLAPIPCIDRRPPPALRTLGFLGALSRSKGVELLLELAPELARQGITLRIAGTGPLHDQVQDAEAVEFVGPVVGPEVGAFLTSCDAGVVPSLWEEPGLTYVLHEWLAAGRPVLATDRGGLAEAVRYGGVVSFDGSRNGFAAAIDAMREPTAWRELVQAVPAVDDNSDFERWIDEHEASFELALDRSAAAVR